VGTEKKKERLEDDESEREKMVYQSPPCQVSNLLVSQKCRIARKIFLIIFPFFFFLVQKCNKIINPRSGKCDGNHKGWNAFLDTKDYNSQMVGYDRKLNRKLSLINDFLCVV
jgi:hypothetical protein